MQSKKRLGKWLAVAVVLAFITSAANAMAPNPSQAGAGSAPAGSNSVYLPLVYKPGTSYYDWLQFDYDSRHSGNNPAEQTITSANVSTLQELFQVTLPAVADGAPVYLSNVSTSTGTRNVVFMNTRTGEVVALDASTGSTIWAQPITAPSCLINNNKSRNEACYTTSSPAIDPNRQYIYSYGLDGYVHKFAVADGTEVKTGGWPELASLKVYDEKGSSALANATDSTGTSYLYVTNGGYPGDAGNYQGHLTAINLSDGTQKVFNSLCSNQTVHFVDSRVTSGADCYPSVQSGMWARASVIYDPDTDRIYSATGNATFAPAQFLWGDTVFSLHPDGSGAGNGNPLDSYTPSNYQTLNSSDLDLGSTLPGILPTTGTKYPHLAVQGGKDSVLRLLNLDNLSGQGQVGKTGGELFSITLSFGGQILTQPAVWVNPADQTTWVFVSDGSGLAALQLVLDGSGNPSLTVKWTSGSGTSPIVANGVLYYVRNNLISALNPTSGSVLWSNNQIGSIHWQSPIVDNGVLYIADQSGKLTAYSLP